MSLHSDFGGLRGFSQITICYILIYIYIYQRQSTYTCHVAELHFLKMALAKYSVSVLFHSHASPQGQPDLPQARIN